MVLNFLLIRISLFCLFLLLSIRGIDQNPKHELSQLLLSAALAIFEVMDETNSLAAHNLAGRLQLDNHTDFHVKEKLGASLIQEEILSYLIKKVMEELVHDIDMAKLCQGWKVILRATFLGLALEPSF